MHIFNIFMNIFHFILDYSFAKLYNYKHQLGIINQINLLIIFKKIALHVCLCILYDYLGGLLK